MGRNAGDAEVTEIKPVAANDQFKHDVAVMARIDAAERRKRLIEKAQWGLVVGSLFFGASGWVVWATHPQIVKEMEYMPVAEDGSRLLALRDDELPPEAKQRDIQNSVITYVLRREGYNSYEADKNWDVVSRMSSKDIRDDYQSINALNKEGSQSRIYGDNGWIRVEYDSMEDLVPTTGYKDVPPAYLVRFCRQVKKKDKNSPERAELWGATVVFKANVTGYDRRFIAAYNPGRIQVTDYPNVRPIGPLVNTGNRLSGCGAIK